MRRQRAERWWVAALVLAAVVASPGCGRLRARRVPPGPTYVDEVPPAAASSAPGVGFSSAPPAADPFGAAAPGSPAPADPGVTPLGEPPAGMLPADPGPVAAPPG